MNIRAATSEEAAELTRIAHEAKSYWGYPEHWLQRWDADLTITPELRRNVHMEFYEAGHMMYVHPDSMRKFGETTKAFIDANSN